MAQYASLLNLVMHGKHLFVKGLILLLIELLLDKFSEPLSWLLVEKPTVQLHCFDCQNRPILAYSTIGRNKQRKQLFTVEYGLDLAWPLSSVRVHIRLTSLVFVARLVWRKLEQKPIKCERAENLPPLFLLFCCFWARFISGKYGPTPLETAHIECPEL